MEIIPFDDRDGQIWFNGELIDWREAKIHVLSHGLHYASSVFEGERAKPKHWPLRGTRTPISAPLLGVGLK